MKQNINLTRWVRALYVIFLLGVGAVVAVPVAAPDFLRHHPWVGLLILAVPFASIILTVILKHRDKRKNDQ